MTLPPFFRDNRRRTLTILAGLALLSLLLAAAALSWRQHQSAANHPERLLFPDLAAHLHDVAAIKITSARNGGFDIVFHGMKGWVLPGRDFYPASFATVRQMLNALAQLRTVEPKTARPEWHARVKLDAPPGGGGTEIRLSDAHGKTLAALIVGAEDETVIDGVRLFVRRADDAQSWLAQMPAPPPLRLDQWMEHDLIAIDRARIQSAAFTPQTGPGFTLRRADGAETFQLLAAPKGRSRLPEQIEAAATALAGFAFDDVRPGGEMRFDDASHIVTRSFDGLILAVDVLKKDGVSWARLTAAADAGSLDAAKEARAINAKSYGWAFKLTPQAAAGFEASLESLLEPKK